VDAAAPENINGALVDKILLTSAEDMKDTCFLKEYFKDRTLVFETNLPRSAKNKLAHPGAAFTYHSGRRYELVSVKIKTDGYEFFGRKKRFARLLYVAENSRMSISDELDRVADFSSLPNARKAAARLELLQSSVPVDRVFQRVASDFELIEEPQPTQDAGGCGFISDEMLLQLLGDTPANRRVSSIQVRIYGPQLGVVKGMLRRKPGIQKIQLPPSMMKVPPSIVSFDDWAILVAIRVTPFQRMHLQMNRWLRGDKLPKSYKQHKLSPMMERLLVSLRVPKDDLETYNATAIRKDAYLVGVADPTGAIPDGHVVLPGIPAEHIPTHKGVRSVFVTRSPCVKPSDGKILPVVTSKPAGVTDDNWNALTQSHFGEIVFPTKGDPLPQLINEGDIDGDLFWVCWDQAIVKGVRPRLPVGSKLVASNSASTLSFERKFLGRKWLARAQEHMLDDNVLHEGMLVGKFYNAAVKKLKASPLGMDDPDVQALFTAYSQSIDMGKHGGKITLPEHLRKELRLPGSAFCKNESSS
jgi:hypothetical protein